LQSNYPDFEIVLIDDASERMILERFEEFEKSNTLNIRCLAKVENNEALWQRNMLNRIKEHIYISPTPTVTQHQN
jgi:hypothetical protein